MSIIIFKTKQNMHFIIDTHRASYKLGTYKNARSVKIGTKQCYEAFPSGWARHLTARPSHITSS